MSENAKKDVTVEAKTVGAVAEALDVQVRIKDPFSLRHAYHACLLAKKSLDFENANKNLPTISDEIRFENTAYVISSIFAAVAFLEAFVNEVFLQAVDQVDTNIIKGRPAVGYLAALSVDAITSMAQVWRYGIEFDQEHGIELDKDGNKTSRMHGFLAQFLLIDKPDELNKEVERWTIENKYQLALFVSGHPRSESFCKGNPSCTEVNTLIRLRNHFTHYKPEWHTSVRGHPMAEQRATRRLAHELRKLGFDNPLFRATGGIPLEEFLGAKCAHWAATSSLNFADRFATDTKIELYQHVRDLISNC